MALDNSFYDSFYKELEKKMKKQEEEKKKTSKPTSSSAESKSTDDGSLNNDFYNSFYAELEKKQALSPEELKKQIDERDKEMLRANAEKMYAEMKDRTWFKKSKSDNVLVAAGATTVDAIQNAGIGIMESGEGIIDALVALSPYISQGQFYANGGGYNAQAENAFRQLNKQQKEAAAQFAAKDLYDSEALVKKIVDVSDYSFLGEKSTGLAQSAGQLGVQTGLNLIPGAGPVLSMAYMGTSAYGKEMEEALQNIEAKKKTQAELLGIEYTGLDESDINRAAVSALVTAGAELATEQLSGIRFGGNGAKTVGDIIPDNLINNVSDKVVRTLMNMGYDATGEGFEEILSGIVSDIGKKITYAPETEVGSLAFWKWNDEQWEEFISGAVLGFGASGISKGVTAAKGFDIETGFNSAERAVSEKVTQKTVEAAEKESGKKLTNQQKRKIELEVIDRINNGELPVEEIEEALGGKAYTNYTQAVEGRKALDAEYESLLKKKEGDFTRGDTLRFEELTKAREYDVVGKARQALDKTLGGVKGTRLEESYRERARRGEDFAFDASSVDSKLRDTYKRAAESGILNNTRKTHQLVDFIARISSDKGVSFDFTNNEKLKASGFAVEGRTVNGYVTSDGKTIGINVQSPKALNSVVGHEITHILEGTELYDSFAKLMEEYANTKGEYSSRFEAAKKLYEGKKGYEENLEVKVKKEVIADLAGDYLFTDSKFVEHLLNTDRNVFQRIWDEVKYLYKMATAGTPEAKKLEQVKHTFEKVYRQNGQKNTTREGGGVRYAISTDINGDQFVDVENTIISETDTAKDIADILSDIVENKYGEFVNVSSQKIGINKTTAREWQKSKNAQYLLNTDIGTYTDKMNAFSNADELLTVSKNYIGEKVKHIRKDNFVEFARGEINFKVGQNGYSADIIVGTTKSGVAVLYDIVNLQNKKIEVASNATQNRRTETPSAYSISENSENVKRKAAQFEIILQNNPATDSYHTWIRSARDIKTFEETLSDEDWSDGSDFDPDYTWDMAQKALTSGEITVYSSYPIEAGVFVTPSAMEARSYSGDGRIYSKTVKLTDVAWIDPTQGMFAQVKEGARYSLSEQFYNEYDDWDKTNPRKVFTIGNTSEVLKSLGVKDSEIKWDASKIIKIKANHPEMTDGIIKQVPDIIENPIVVFKSLQNESRLTLFGEVYANGKPILAVLELDPTGRNGASLDEIKIASAYGKDNAQNFINRSEALYIDSNRKRISDWEKRTGLQLPVGLPITDSIDSISENSGNVNSKLSLSDSDIAPTKYDDVRYSLTGKNIDGIEVYETSQDIMNLTWNERKAKYLDMMKNEYRGRTAKFVRNGHTYYATFDSGSIRKPIYGDSRSSTDGIKALIKAGADGNVFELVENSEYTGSKANTKNHTDADYFDYFVKTVQIDGKVFDLIADVEKKYGQNGGFVYTLALKENNKIKASPAHSSKTEPVKSAGNASAYSISKNSGNVNSKLSLSDSDIAPTKYGDYNVYGEEVAKAEASEDIAPIRQDIAPAKKQAEQISFDEAVSVMEYIAAAGESNSFKNRLKNWDGKTTGFSFVIGRPSKALQNAGIPNKQIRMDASKIKTILAQHEAMDIDTISQIPDLLNNPVVVIDSKQNENARIVMGDLHDKNGKTVTAVLLLTPTSRNGNVLNVIKVSSAQGRGHIASLFKNDDGSSVNVRYTDKKRIQAWLNANRLQLPLHNLSLDSEAESHIGISANESIPQFAPTVNNGTAVSGDIAPVSEDTDIVTDSEDVREAEAQSESGEDYPTRRKAFHAQIVEDIKRTFSENGFDFDEVLKKAKNLSTFATVDNTPQRVMEKALGYKEGGILSDITVNKVAQNETEGIRWLNSYTDRKSGILAQLSKKYKIKPGSKQSAAAQMYAEGFYVDENNDIIRYGDAELAKDFPNAEEQARIKGLATDPTIRQIYDDTLDRINRSRTRNVYDAIPRLDNYFLHFRAMNDTFSRLGVPFNPNDIRAKDLPTDLNGVTADLKPGQPYFASANHRYGVRTDFDILGGLERYLTSAKNQIYHIDDIQILRALRNYIADTFGQANGLGNLDALSDAEAEERIRQVYSSHLSTFAKFLNEEANVLAGKTALIDRGLEGIIGRRGMAFLNTVNGQVGSNMVGFNLSSSLTNFLPIVQTFAKSKKTAFVKAFGQTVANRIGKLFGRGDSFANDSPVMIRREGADRFYRTPWQKAGDAGYVLMSTVDSISTELIARTKYNEFVKKGMTSEQAHYETDKWVSRLMADRSLGQTPQIYNSKMLGIITKFQLEVRNQLDAQFYDTIQEAKLSNEYIKNCLLRNAKTAAKVTSTFVQLAIVQNLFGKAFESIAGYNPAFDIIEVIATAVGWDDDESEDTVLDNIEQAFFDLLEDLPYTSTLTGGRIPMASALPLTELIKGVDKYGNDKSRWKTAAEALPYYILPGGYGQIKKTAQGLVMFDDDLSVSGSYTDSGKLRFPVEDTLESMFKAGLFGQWANENAREYFDEGRSALTEKQTQEFVDSGMSIHDYWEYREGLKGLGSVSEKFDYIDSLDISDEQKNLLINNLVDRKTPVNISNYGDYSSYEEFSFATDNPGKYQIARAVGGYEKFSTYRTTLNGIKAGNDTKTQRFAYIDGLKINEEYKWILKKMCYESYDDHNSDIVKYVNSLKMTAAEKKLLLDELGL